MTTTTLQLQPLPMLQLARVTTRVTDEAEISAVISGLVADLRNRTDAAGQCTEGALICTYYGPPGGGPIEVSVAIEVAQDQADIAGVEITELPAQERGASIRHQGGPEGIADAWVTLDTALEPYGLTTSGVYRQINPTRDGDAIILQAPVVPLAACS